MSKLKELLDYAGLEFKIKLYWVVWVDVKIEVDHMLLTYPSGTEILPQIFLSDWLVPYYQAERDVESRVDRVRVPKNWDDYKTFLEGGKIKV